MIGMAGILGSSSPIAHILDVTWRIGGREVPWMSAHSAVMVLAAVLLILGLPLLTRLSRRRTDRVGLGAVEILVTFVRVQVAERTLGSAADKAVPYLTTLFTYLLTLNLLGLVPLREFSAALGLTGWGGVDAAGRPLNVTPVGGTPTSGVWVGAAFSVMTLLLVIFSGYVRQVRLLWRGAPGGPPSEAEPVAEPHEHPAVEPGMNVWLDWSNWISRRKWPLPLAVVGALWTWLNSFVPAVPGTVGLLLWPVLLVLEVLSYFTKCFALCIRLVANMASGHILLAVLLTFAQQSQGWQHLYVAVPAGLGVVALMILELVVALLQAYIFTFLSALFVGLAMNPHH
ncbi:MAG: F0F1 ATP synthase subunit A [Planctomycetota bacterium]